MFPVELNSVSLSSQRMKIKPEKNENKRKLVGDTGA